MSLLRSLLVVAALAMVFGASSFLHGAEPAAASVTPVAKPPAELKLDPFYQKYVSANGFPIVSSAKVSDYALLEAAYLVNLMLAKRPDVRQAMIRSGSRLVVMAYNEFTTDIPEYKAFRPKDFWDRRARGLGGSATDPVCSCAEENVLAFQGDPYSTECILIHEFAHNIHLRGMATVDPSFDARLKKTYDDAMARGLWQGKYASTNHHEYFAEGVQSWFDNNRPPDHDHNHVRTRKALKEYDPGLAARCEEVFGDTELVYTYPTTRLKDHLAGYEPAKSPQFEWPERLARLSEEVKRDALAKRPGGTAAAEGAAAANAAAKPETPAAGQPGEPKYQTRELAGWKVHIRQELIDQSPEPLEKALKLLTSQLEEIRRVVPAAAVTRLQQVPLWISPEYPGTMPRAEYHPEVKWLRENGRDPHMAQGVEFTNVRIFEAETQRMPLLALHELAHAYHDQVLGFSEPTILAAYAQAKASKTYDEVERWRGPNRPVTKERAYAMTNEREYFAECTEAFFGRNDFFPFVRAELERHDPEMVKVLTAVWNRPAAALEKQP